MCMRNLNTNAWFCKSIVCDDDGNVTGYQGVFSGLKADAMEENCPIVNMYIVYSVFAMDVSDPQDGDFSFDESYEMAIRLAKAGTNLSQDLKVFDLPETFEALNINNQPRKSLNYKGILKLSNYSMFDGMGKYQIKILVRQKNDTKWTIQSVHEFDVS